MKKALITGITGQDGSYLAELLLSKGYEVHGIIRCASTFNTSRINHIYVDPHKKTSMLFLHYGDLSDSEQISWILHRIAPQEVYHLGAQSHVRVSFDIPEYTSEITAIGTTRILESIRQNRKTIKMYQASSSELFGASPPPQNESTHMKPQSPYACSKLYAYWMARNYRSAYNMFVSNGILFNHESPRRGETFVTRKITRAIASILAKKQKFLYLGNLEARRDWGYAPEYVEAMREILQQKSPDDYVIGTGEDHTIKEFVAAAFDYAGLDHRKHVRIDKRYFRPLEADRLLADPKLTFRKLKWKPRIKFQELVKIMVDADMRKAGLRPVGGGDKILRKKFPDRWWRTD
ncbi:MAG: GDP-mannose 4,6-dehydratase [Candidatus Omnitrophota bacterium]